MMQVGVDPIRVNANTKLTENEDAETVAQDAQWDDRQGQDSSRPGATEQEISGEQTGDKQRKAGMDATAFRSDVHGKAGQLEFHTGLEDRHSGELQKQVGGIG